MKKNFNMLLDIREKKKYWLSIFILVLIFTTFNNYYFYSYVQHRAKATVEQLKLLLIGDLKYFRTNKITDIRYREHTKVLVVNFSKKVNYNKSITLNYQNAISKTTGKVKKGYESWTTPEKNYEKVVQSTIVISVPKLKSNQDLIYISDIKQVSFFNKEFLLSVFRSMTLSITDVIADVQQMTLLEAYNKWKYKYLPRSRNPLIFLFVLYILFYRIRKYQIELYEEIDRLEGMLPESLSKDIQIIMDCLKIKDTKKLKLLINNGIQIDSKDSEGMTALMLYMLTDQTNKDKKEVIKILLDNGANINARNNVGMTPLMMCAQKDKEGAVKILLDNGADTTIKQELTAKDIGTKSIKKIINETQNTYPQELIKILSNFTNKPMKFTTHDWDFGSLKSVFGTFDEAMEAVKKQFDSIDRELIGLSSELHRKISIFLFNKDPNKEDKWCSKFKKSDKNIGWLSLEGLKEWCDDGNSAFDFKIKDPIVIDNNELNTFGEIINLFKQEIEMRIDFNNLEQIFSGEKKKLGRSFKLNLIDSKLQRQFYTDTESFSFAIKKIFIEIKKRIDYPNIEVSTKEFEDRSLEIKITQIGSSVDKNSKTLVDEIKSGDFSDIKEALNNLCDWSIESNCEDGNFRINYLHSNNVQDIEPIANVNGFTHILRFYR